jgi:hypothetical protein
MLANLLLVFLIGADALIAAMSCETVQAPTSIKR